MATGKKTAMTTIEISTPRHAAQMYAGALLSSRKRPGVVRALKPVTYVRPAVTLDAAQVAAYAKVCGFKPEAGVPVLYPQMLTFPLVMEFLASEYCPWPAMGTVHLARALGEYSPPVPRELAQVAEAVGVSTATILRWSEQGALPRPVIVHGGRRGRMARWPLEAAAQARWVQGLLDIRMTWEEIREALAAGKFTAQGG